MSTSRPFSYNPSQTNIPGTYNIGTMCVGDSSQEYINNYGGLHWWNGPDEDLGYCIGTVVPAQNQSTPLGNIGNVEFWRTQEFTDAAFLILVQEVTGQFFTDIPSAYAYLDSNNYWTSYPKQVITPMAQGVEINLSAVQVSYFVVKNRCSSTNNFRWQVQQPVYNSDGDIDYYITTSEGVKTYYNMAQTIPAYQLFQKPNSNKTGVSNYLELGNNDIGSPEKFVKQYPTNQINYPNGKWLTTVNVYKKGDNISFGFPDGGTATYGKQVYKNIVTPYIP